MLNKAELTPIAFVKTVREYVAHCEDASDFVLDVIELLEKVDEDAELLGIPIVEGEIKPHKICNWRKIEGCVGIIQVGFRCDGKIGVLADGDTFCPRCGGVVKL